MARGQRQPTRAVVRVRYAWIIRTMALLYAAWTICRPQAWAQEQEQPEHLMLDRAMLTDGRVDLEKLLLSPTQLNGPPLAGFVEVHAASVTPGKAWLRTSQGCMFGRLRHGALRVRLNNACEVQVHVDGPFALLRCDDRVIAQLDLDGLMPVQVRAGVAWVPTTRLVVDAARQATFERVCTEKSRKKQKADIDKFTVVDGVSVTPPQTATPPTPLDWTPAPEDCTKPAHTGDLRLLQQARLDVIGRRWSTPSPAGLQVYHDKSSCDQAATTGRHTSTLATRTNP
jgi:hypothetical protein